MHVDPNLAEKAFVLLFNPSQYTIQEKIRIPLYHAGLENEASIAEADGNAKTFKLNRRFEVELDVQISPKGYSWYVIH